MTRLPLLLLALALSGCTSAGQGEPLRGPAPSSAAPSAAPSPAGGAPVLQLTSRCYGACAFVDPLGLPQVVVYADGRVVRAERSAPFDRPAALTTGTVDAATRDRLLALARDARLDEGGTTELDYPSGPFFADGGGDVLTGRLDGRTTTVESPHSYDAALDPRSSDPERRAALRALAEALRELAAPQALPSQGVVLQAERSEPTAREDGSWDGPALSALPETEAGRCAVLEGAEADRALAAVADDAFPSTYLEDGVRWRVQARAVLPHEQDCADVAETVRTSGVGRSVG